MAISTTGHRLLCILCSVYVLSKMLKLCSAEGSSFRFWWMLSAVSCWGRILIVLRFTRSTHCDAVVRLLFLRQQLGVDLWMLSTLCCWNSVLVYHQTYWLLGSVRISGGRCPFACSPAVGCCTSMLSVLWWNLSDGELAVARTVCVCVSLRVMVHQNFVSEIPLLVLISLLVCHNRLVPGFTDGAGFRVVTMS